MFEAPPRRHGAERRLSSVDDGTSMSASATAQLAHLKKSAASERGLRVTVFDNAVAPDVVQSDVLFFAAALEGDLRRGDILLYHLHGRQYVRRFVGMTDTADAVMVVMRDSAGWEDMIPWAHVVGRAIRCERDGEPLRASGVRGAADHWWKRLFSRQTP